MVTQALLALQENKPQNVPNSTPLIICEVFLSQKILP